LNDVFNKGARSYFFVLASCNVYSCILQLKHQRLMLAVKQ